MLASIEGRCRDEFGMEIAACAFRLVNKLWFKDGGTPPDQWDGCFRQYLLVDV